MWNMRFLRSLLGVRAVAIIWGTVTALLLCKLYFFSSSADEALAFYHPDDDPNPDMSTVVALSQYMAQHPIRPPYQDQRNQLIKRTAFLRQWLNLNRHLEDPASKQLLFNLTEQLAISTFPFLEKPLGQHPVSQHPFADLVASFQPGSKGIVIPTGDGSIRSVSRLLANLRVVLGSTLPIEVAYAGDHDLSAENRMHLSRLELPGPPLQFLDINTLFNESKTQLQPGSGDITPFAALGSRFEWVIVVDPDVGFLQPPEVLLENERIIWEGKYSSADRLQWYHKYKDPNRWEKYIAPEIEKYTPNSDGASLFLVDSGLAVFDKGRANILMFILFACWRYSYDVQKELTYPFKYGSGDVWWYSRGTFPYGFPLQHEPYGGVIGWESPYDEYCLKVCGSAIAHVDPDGRLLWWKGNLTPNQEEVSGVPPKWTAQTAGPRGFGSEWEEIRGTQEEVKSAISHDVYCMSTEEPKSLTDAELKILERSMQVAKKVDNEL